LLLLLFFIYLFIYLFLLLIIITGDDYLGCKADVTKKTWTNYVGGKPEILGNLLSDVDLLIRTHIDL